MVDIPKVVINKLKMLMSQEEMFIYTAVYLRNTTYFKALLNNVIEGVQEVPKANFALRKNKDKFYIIDSNDTLLLYPTKDKVAVKDQLTKLLSNAYTYCSIDDYNEELFS